MKDAIFLSELLGSGLGSKKSKKSKSNILDDQKASEAIRDFNKKTRRRISDRIQADAIERDGEILVVYQLPGVASDDPINLSLTQVNSQLMTHKLFLQVDWEKSEAYDYTDEDEDVDVLKNGIIKPNGSSQEHTLKFQASGKIEANEVEANLEHGLLKVQLPYKENTQQSKDWNIEIND